MEISLLFSARRKCLTLFPKPYMRMALLVNNDFAAMFRPTIVNGDVGDFFFTGGQPPSP